MTTTVVLIAVLVALSCHAVFAQNVTTPLPSPTPNFRAGVILFNRTGLLPEGIEYNPLTKRYLVGSLSEGTIYEVSNDGSLNRFSRSDSESFLSCSAGLQVDAKKNHLYVCNQDAKYPNVGTRVNLIVLSLVDGSFIRNIDLSGLGSNDKLLNDVSPPDAAGFIYATDSLNGVIFRINPDAGTAEVYFQSDALKPNDATGVGANGIDLWHEGGDVSKEFLIVAKSGNTTSRSFLHRVEVTNTTSSLRLLTVDLDTNGVGYDGLVFDRNGKGAGNLYAISSTRAYRYSSYNWRSASLIQTYFLSCEGGTTGALVDAENQLAVTCLNPTFDGAYVINVLRIRVADPAPVIPVSGATVAETPGSPQSQSSATTLFVLALSSFLIVLLALF